MSQNEDPIVNWLRSSDNISSILPNGISIDREIAVGGQGVVFHGAVDGVEAAIKIYFPGQIQSRVDREVDALKRLACPNIVRLLWNSEVKIGHIQLPVVATEFVNGRLLGDIIRRGKLLSDDLHSLACDVAIAIEAMWASKIVHRDLKPSNILIKPDGSACVIDLGVARHIDRSSLTAMGSTWGTTGYLSPEQAMAVRQLTCKSDIYALGILLVEGALGRHPTYGDQALLFKMNYHQNLPPPIAQWDLSPLVKRMLNPRATARPRPSDIVEQLKGH